jgi:plastocyanin
METLIFKEIRNMKNLGHSIFKELSKKARISQKGRTYYCLRMKTIAEKYLIGYSRSLFSVSPIKAVLILAMLIVFPSVGNGSQDMGYVTGTVAVFQKNHFGRLKKKKDRSNTVVFIAGFKSELPDEIKDITQNNKQFIPGILPVVPGQHVRFPNQDSIYHNVFSISPLKSFDLGQYKGSDTPKIVTFENYGVVPVYCNIHPKMIAYVVVLENKAYALTNKEGIFEIKDIPPGIYTINAWRPKAKRVSQEIIIQPGKQIHVQLEIKEIARIKPHKRKDGSDYPEGIAEGCVVIEKR